MATVWKTPWWGRFRWLWCSRMEGRRCQQLGEHVGARKSGINLSWHSGMPGKAEQRWEGEVWRSGYEWELVEEE